MKENQTLLIIERVIASDQPRLEAVLADMNMMIMNGGRKRTKEEFQALLSAAGFELTQVIPTRSSYVPFRHRKELHLGPRLRTFEQGFWNMGAKVVG
jgi:O-methyltransferase